MWLSYVIAAVVVLAVVIGVWDARWRSSLARIERGVGEAEGGRSAEGYGAKRAEAAKASQTAEFYAHLAEEQEARAEELMRQAERGN